MYVKVYISRMEMSQKIIHFGIKICWKSRFFETMSKNYFFGQTFFGTAYKSQFELKMLSVKKVNFCQKSLFGGTFWSKFKILHWPTSFRFVSCFTPFVISCVFLCLIIKYMKIKKERRQNPLMSLPILDRIEYYYSSIVIVYSYYSAIVFVTINVYIRSSVKAI